VNLKKCKLLVEREGGGAKRRGKGAGRAWLPESER